MSRELAGFALWAVLCSAAGTGFLRAMPTRERVRSPTSPVVAPEAGDAEDEAPQRGGRFHRARDGGRDSDADLLEQIGYVAGSQEATELSGVTVHDPARAWQGLNLYTSGHAAEAILMDMDGRVLHRWRKDYVDIAGPKANTRNPNVGFWRRARALPNGHLLAIVEGVGIVELDRDSNLVWKAANRAHHDLEILPDGRIWVLTRKQSNIEEISRTKMVVEDAVSLLEPDGDPIRTLSLVSAYRDSPFDHWRPERGETGDFMHTNTLELLDGSLAHLDPAFRAGNLLISMRQRDAIAIVDPDAGRVVWSKKGDFRHQHDPHLLPDGKLLLFDNHPEARRSRALELDPVTLAELWRYDGTDERPLFSATCGTAVRLPNGNTLVTESDAGRAVEVARDGTILWEFYNPHRPADDPTLVATLFDVERLPLTFGADWLQAPAAGAAE